MSNRYLFLLIILCVTTILSSCTKNELLDVVESSPFEVTNMPYYQDVSLGEPVEIRCTLANESEYEGLQYTIRYFPTRGEGILRVGQGEALKPNDRYPIEKGDFRLYYIPTEEGSHSLDLVFEDNGGESYSVTLEFDVDTQEEEGDSSINGSSEGESLNMGEPYLGENGNWFINGQDTGIESGIETGEPIVEIIGGNWHINGQNTGIAAGSDDTSELTIGENGNWYINGQDSGIKAQVNPFDPIVYIGENGNWHINGQDTGIVAGSDDISELTIGENGNWYINGLDTGIGAPSVNKPEVGINDDGNYTVGGEDTDIPVPVSDYDPISEENLDENTVPIDPSILILGGGLPQVLLVSKGGETIVDGEMIEYTGVLVKDGSAIYRVFDGEGNPAPHAYVREMPLLGENSYRADDEGYFVVRREELPSDSVVLGGVAQVTIDGEVLSSAATVDVPKRLLVGFALNYTLNGEFHFGFTQKGGSEESGIVELPLDVPIDEFLTDGNWMSYGKVYSIDGRQAGWDIVSLFGMKGMSTEVTEASLQMNFGEIVSEQPVELITSPFYVTISVANGPYGCPIEETIFLGFLYSDYDFEDLLGDLIWPF